MSKRRKLVLSLLFDVIGYVSFIIPGVGELLDIIWAPISAYLMMRMYDGKKGKIGAVLNFIEEAMPGIDVLPTFTLMWCHSYIFKKDNREMEKR
ncbi:hypothetical protein [Tenacibaculum maritimum]|uniref:hypothetical protein n=1 Tax=Tenacibaculum maritimum TaxID=107401 RepID=UPI003876DAAF